MSTEPDAAVLGGGSFYDNESVFANYTAHRQWDANANKVMEEPALLDVLGDVRGARVIDLGCGDAELGRTLLASGAVSYHGIDSSRNMIELATRILEGTVGHVTLGTIEQFSAPAGSVDLVVSRLALHYVEHIEPVVSACHACLVPGGRLVFTVSHPVITSHDARTGEKRTSWIVDDYFVRGPRPQHWLGGHTVWYHRTIEDYVGILGRAGFQLVRLSECEPDQRALQNHPGEFRRRQRVPLILLLAGEKISSP